MLGAVTPERVVSAKRFMAKLEQLHQVRLVALGKAPHQTLVMALHMALHMSTRAPAVPSSRHLPLHGDMMYGLALAKPLQLRSCARHETMLGHEC